jgi:hypothetical protein
MIETICIVCGHVFRSERQVKLVLHHADGVRQLVCGETDHPDDCSDFEPVGLEHLLERQPNLNEVIDLERGWMAERGDDGWLFEAIDD